jgi:hypothetical protein
MKLDMQRVISRNVYSIHICVRTGYEVGLGLRNILTSTQKNLVE